MKKKILLTGLIFSIVAAQGEHPTGSKKTEHPAASIKPQIVQGEKITFQNLAVAIESCVEAVSLMFGYARYRISCDTEAVTKADDHDLNKSQVF